MTMKSNPQSIGRNRPIVPEVLQSKYPTATLIRHEIWNRLHKNNEHYQGVVVGREGKGKSGTAMAISQMVDPDMNLAQVMFDPGVMLKKIHRWKQNSTTTGRMIVADEAGVGLGNRTWYDADQIRFAQVLQLIRSENMGILFTLPRGKEMDSQVRTGRLHGQIIIDSKADGDYTQAQYEYVNVGRRIDADGLYTPKRLMNIDGVTRRVKTIRIGPPDSELWEEYVEKKNSFQAEQYKQAARDMGEMVEDEDEVNELKQMAMDLTDGRMEAVVSEHPQTGEPYINKDLIRVECDVGGTDANAVKSLLAKQFSQEELDDYV